ncbi:MAG: amino acid--tRNA ligase-related protein, partial [Roseovarius sp.]
GSGFAIFAKLLEQDGTEIRAIPAPTGGSRKFCDRMNAFAQKEGLPGMGYIFWRTANDEVNALLAQHKNISEHFEAGTQVNYKFQKTGEMVSGERDELLADIRNRIGEIDYEMEAAGPLAKNIGPERTEAIRQQLGLDVGDAAFFLGGKPAAFERVAGKARVTIGEELGLTDENRFAFAWIVDFPMYEADEESGEIDFSHNPFSMPQGGIEALEGDPLKVLGYQYDLSCNGYELVSGAIRNHRLETMIKAFELAGYDEAEVRKRFGGMVGAFQYGAPPHGGCAAGIDRIVMLLADEQNIREVIMFPMNQRAEDLMMNAPSEPASDQLMELGLRVLPREE